MERNKMNRCCETLLAQIAELYDTTPQEILNKLGREKCTWIFRSKNKHNARGDRCKIPVHADGYVFCSKHDKAARANLNCIMLGTTGSFDKHIDDIVLSDVSELVKTTTGTTETIYVPTIGLIEKIKEKNIVTYALSQGNVLKLEQAAPLQLK